MASLSEVKEGLEAELASLADAPEPSLVFLPDGSATAATLHLRGAGRQAVLRIAWIGGRVQLDD